MMKQLSEKLTQFVIDSGAISKESYAVYQYGFQIGLEMLTCLAVCSGIAVYLHMIPEFIALTVFFMLLRSFAGGVHLIAFGSVSYVRLWYRLLYWFSMIYLHFHCVMHGESS